MTRVTRQTRKSRSARPLVLGALEDFIVGQRPAQPRSRPRAPRAVRTALKRVDVAADAVIWRSRRGGGQVDTRDVGRVALIETVYAGPTAMGTVVLYALVIDHGGAVRLRVAAEGSGGARGVRSKHALRDIWEPLGVPVARETGPRARPKDYRRRWPEAFGIVHSYPFMILALAAAAWMLVVVPLLDRGLSA